VLGVLPLRGSGLVLVRFEVVGYCLFCGLELETSERRYTNSPHTHPTDAMQRNPRTRARPPRHPQGDFAVALLDAMGSELAKPAHEVG